MVQETLPEPQKRGLHPALFPALTDAGDRKEITSEQAIALIEWSKHYGLDAWAGHTAFMFGKPYITEKGAVANATAQKGYKGYALYHISQTKLESLGYPKEAKGWECVVFVEGRDQPAVEYGVVTRQEVTDAENRYGEKARFLPIVNSPSTMARVRAIRRAHLLAFPLKGYEDEGPKTD